MHLIFKTTSFTLTKVFTISWLQEIKTRTLKYDHIINVYLLWLIEKQLNDIVSALGVVEEDKEGPVNEPCPLLERLERGCNRLERTKTEI